MLGDESGDVTVIINRDLTVDEAKLVAGHLDQKVRVSHKFLGPHHDQLKKLAMDRLGVVAPTNPASVASSANASERASKKARHSAFNHMLR